MKRIIKDIYDIKEGETFYFDDGTKFRVVFSNKDLGRFIAVCEECEEKDKIGKQVSEFNFDGLNVKFMTDYIDKVVDKEGKEVETERAERKESTIEKLVKAAELIDRLQRNPDDLEAKKEAYEFSKKETLKLLKSDEMSLEDKKELIEAFKDFQETYKEAIEEDSEVEEFINELEEE